MKRVRWVTVLLLLVFGPSTLGCSDKQESSSAVAEGEADAVDPLKSAEEAGGSNDDDGAEIKDGTTDSRPTAEVTGKRASVPKKSLLELTSGAGFDQLKEAVARAGLTEALAGDEPITLFAPNDAAFKLFEDENPGFLAGLSDEALKELLRYHMIPGKFKSEDFLSGQLVATLTGAPLALLEGPNGPVLNMQRLVTTSNIEATNGYMHVVNEVIMPPGDLFAETKDVEELKKLSSAISKAGLEERFKAKGQFTLFAPSDEAFAQLDTMPTGDKLKDLLLYHVWDEAHGPIDMVHEGVGMTLLGAPVAFLANDGTTVNGSTFYAVNTVASNGVLHVMESVLTPPTEDVVAAVKTAGFGKFAALLDAAGVADALRGAGPFTVFAPTDEALAALKALPEGEALKDFVLYHVVDGSALGAGNLKAGQLKTKAGTSITVGDGERPALNGTAHISAANLLARNGVIQGIDKALTPAE